MININQKTFVSTLMIGAGNRIGSAESFGIKFKLTGSKKCKVKGK